MTTLQTVAWAVVGVLAIVALVAAVVWTEARAIDLTGERFHFDDDDAPRDDNDWPTVLHDLDDVARDFGVELDTSPRRLNGDH